MEGKDVKILGGGKFNCTGGGVVTWEGKESWQVGQQKGRFETDDKRKVMAWW